MVKYLSTDVAASRFRRKARSMIYKGDKRGLRHEFADPTASAIMQEGEGALEVMVHELRELLEEPHRDLHRNVF